MDLGSECWVRESVEDNEGIANDSTSDSKLQNNGCVVVENKDTNALNYKGGGDVESKPEASSPLLTNTRKGYGLKKWRRIKRDSVREVGSGDNTGEMVAPELRYSGANRSKRVQYTEVKEKGEGSVSSTNAVVRNFGGLSLLDDSNLGLSPSFAAGTDSENSEDRSSKSSTAASAPKIKCEMPLIGGFPRDKSKMIGLNGSNSTQFGQRGKGRAEPGKKARGERVKIEKENSHSSVESDSRSANFVFVQGTHSPNNGVRNEGTNEYDGENGDAVEGVGRQGNDGHEGHYDLSHEDAVADSSWVDKDGSGEFHVPLRGKDLLAESLRALQSAQEALEQEVLKFKEIGNDVSVDGEHTYKERGTNDVISELEELFKQKVEAEVEHLVISTRVQKLTVAVVDQISDMENYKAEQIQMLHKLKDAENKAAQEADKLEKSDELLKLQRIVGKYGLCFAAQLVVFLILFVILQFSQDYVELVPT